MEYAIEFDEAKEICTIHVTGRVKRPEDSMVLQQLTRDIGDEQGCRRFLFDMMHAEIVTKPIDAFEAGTVPVDKDHRQGRQRIALVYSSIHSDHSFMETVAVNRGYQLRVFDKMDQAVAWLGPEKNNEQGDSG